MMLTPWEKEILQCAFNFDGDYIATAKALGTSQSTINNCMKRYIFPKMMVHNKEAAFRTGLALGIISLETSIKTNPTALLSRTD